MKFKRTLLSLILIGSILGLQLPVYAQNETVKITFPQFPIVINSLEVDNSRLEYPLIIYNNITYFPMTYDFSRGLGLALNYSKDKGLEILNAPTNFTKFSVTYLDTSPITRENIALLPSYSIKVNNTLIYNENEPYPLLNYKGISYFPLTWKFAVEDFGWQYTFDANTGLHIKASKSPIKTEVVAEPKTDTNDETINADETVTKVLNQIDYSVPLPSIYNVYSSMGSAVQSIFVRDQGDSSTCWAFAANTLFEIALAKQYQVYVNLSEDHLILNAPINVDYDSGGYINVATSYFNNWLGPVIDPDDVFGDGQTNNNLEPDYVLSDYIEITDDFNTLKQAIYKYGAAQSSIGFDESKNYYNEEYYGFYNNDINSKPTHDIVIVGWDDSFAKENFNTPPKKDGAFLVQNSWGNDWGENGLFYVSYEDVHINEKATVITNITKLENTNKQYFYDITGVTHFEGYADTYEATGLNVFKSSASENNDTEYIKSVGFYTNSKDVNFKISYAPEAVPESTYLDLEEIGSGLAALPGYHTYILDEPIKLQPNQTFSMAVTYKDDDTIFLVPLESPYPDIEYTISGNLKESYISADPDYYGFTDIGAERQDSNIAIRVITEFK